MGITPCITGYRYACEEIPCVPANFFLWIDSAHGERACTSQCAESSVSQQDLTGRESLGGRGPGDSAVVVETYFLQPCFRILEKRYEALFTDEHVRVRNQE